MKKKDLIKRVADRTEYSQRQVEEMYDALKDVVFDAVIEGEEFKLFGFIKISTKLLKARSGRLVNKDGKVVNWSRDDKTVPSISFTKFISSKFK